MISQKSAYSKFFPPKLRKLEVSYFDYMALGSQEHLPTNKEFKQIIIRDLDFKMSTKGFFNMLKNKQLDSLTLLDSINQPDWLWECLSDVKAAKICVEPIEAYTSSFEDKYFLNVINKLAATNDNITVILISSESDNEITLNKLAYLTQIKNLHLKFEEPNYYMKNAHMKYNIVTNQTFKIQEEDLNESISAGKFP